MLPIGRDIGGAWRRLQTTPLFTFFSVLTLALSIAAVTVAYAMVRAAAAPPSGVPDVHDLLTISHTRFGHQAMYGFSLPDFEDLRRRQSTMGDVAAFATTQQVLVVEGHGHPSLGEVVSGSYFRMLRVAPALGRLIQPADDGPGAPLVAVISHDVWQRLFGARPDVVGRAVTIAGRQFEVVGVAPPDFVGLYGNGHFPVTTWVPLSAAHVFERLQVDRRRDDRNARWLLVRGRPTRGTTVESVAAEVAAIGAQLDREHPLGRHLEPRLQLPHAVSRAWVVRRAQDLLMDEGSSATRWPAVFMLMAGVGLVLLVACSNLANMVMARLSTRRREFALRLALGASRVRLVFSSVIEVLMIVAAGGVLGLVMAGLSLPWLGGPTDAMRGVVFLLQPRIDGAVLAVALAATAVAAGVAGVVPGWLVTRGSIRPGLWADGSPTVAPRWRGRRVLIVVQVAVSIVLLGTAALFLGQVTAAGRFAGGVDLDRLAVAEVDLALQGFDQDRAMALVARVIDRLDRHPAVAAVAASAGFPFGAAAARAEVRRAGDPIWPLLIPVTPGFFEATGLQLVAGSTFDAASAAAGAPRPVVVDTALATRLFGHPDVVGQQIEVAIPVASGEPGPPQATRIVGVVEPAADGLPLRAGTVYVPLDSRPVFPLLFVARALDDPSRVAGEIRAALLEAEPVVGISRADTARAVVGPRSDAESLAAGVASLLGATGLSVVLAGLYGVLSFLVSRRTREIGMRMALGATPRQVLLMVLREGLMPVLAGVVIGGGMAALLRQSLAAGLMLPVPPADVLLYASVPALIVLATTVACYLPARRAARIDPAVALKQ